MLTTHDLDTWSTFPLRSTYDDWVKKFVVLSPEGATFRRLYDDGDGSALAGALIEDDDGRVFALFDSEGPGLVRDPCSGWWC